MTETTSTFFVTCTSCSTEFPVDPAKVPEGGVLARCSVCDGVFRVEVPEAESPESFTVGELGDTDGVPSAVEETLSDAIEPPLLEEEPVTVEEPTAFDEPAPLEEPSTLTEAAPWEESPAVDEPVSLEEPTTAEEPDALDVSPSFQGPPTFEEPTAFEGVETFEEETALEEAVADDEAKPAFGKRDPHDKAERLARVLVSDMITYNADRHAKALAAGTLEDDFEDEIKKSWAEYVDQVGEEIAESTPYFTEALNEILAQGEKVF